MFGLEHVGNHVLFDKQMGREARLTPMGWGINEQTVRLVGPQFADAADASFWTLANSGGTAASTIASGIATLLSSDTSGAAWSAITSVRKGRFMFAHPNLYRAAIRIPDTAEADNIRKWGVFEHTNGTPSSGFYFELDAGGALSVVCKSTGTTLSKASGSFEGEVDSFVVGTDVTAYEIVYFVMGAWFFVNGQLLHKFTPTTGQLVDNLTLPLAASIVKSAGSEPAQLEVFANSILRLGSSAPAPAFANVTGAATSTLKRGSGTLHRVVCNNTGTPAPTLTIYDALSASGTVIGTIGATTGGIGTLEYGVNFTTGLTVVSTGTAANWTICYD